MADLFGRRYRVIIAGKEGSGIDVTKLRCVFSVEKSMSAEPNRGVIQIYNLSLATQNTILATGRRVILEAGYEGSPQFGLIFDGDVVKALKRGAGGKANGDRITELVAQDGDVFLNSGFVSVSYAAGQTTKSVLSEMAGVGDISLGDVSGSLKGVRLARGKAMFGQPKDYARMLAKTEGALFFVNDRKINLVKPSDPPNGEIVDLSPSSGLVGMPEQTETGIKAKCLLNPLLNLDKLVHVRNDYVQESPDTAVGALGTGVYRIIKLAHVGDTLGNDWHTSFEGVAQPGLIPLTGASYSS